MREFSDFTLKVIIAIQYDEKVMHFLIHAICIKKLNGNYTNRNNIYTFPHLLNHKETNVCKCKTNILGKCVVQCSKYPPFDQKNLKQALSPWILDKNQR